MYTKDWKSEPHRLFRIIEVSDETTTPGLYIQPEYYLRVRTERDIQRHGRSHKLTSLVFFPTKLLAGVFHPLDEPGHGGSHFQRNSCVVPETGVTDRCD